MSVDSKMETSSTRVWSCATLSDGVQHLANLADEEDKIRDQEQQLLQMTKDLEQQIEAAKARVAAESTREPPPPAPQELETLEATPEEVAAATGHPKQVGSEATPVVTPTASQMSQPATPASELPELQPSHKLAEKTPEGTKPEENKSNENKPKPRRPLTRQEKLREAAKARLRRMCANHRSRRDLELPAWVQSEWKTRPQNETAKLFMDCNWCKDKFISSLEIIVKKRSSHTTWVDQEWLTEKEMKEDLKWSSNRIDGAKKACLAKKDTHCRRNRYDNAEEFLVVTKERAQSELSRSTEEIHKKAEKVDEGPTVDPNEFDGLAAMADRVTADRGANSAPEDAQEMETKQSLQTYMSAVLSSCGKLRSLIRDVDTSYKNNTTMQGYSAQLKQQLLKLDADYDKAQECMSRGELSNFKGTFVKEATDLIKTGTMTSSAAKAAEMKTKAAKKYEKKDAEEAAPRKGKDKEKDDKRKGKGKENEGEPSSGSKRRGSQGDGEDGVKKPHQKSKKAKKTK